MIECNRDCTRCSKLNTNTDDKGYPWSYDCLKYGDSVQINQFRSTKQFKKGHDSDV